MAKQISENTIEKLTERLIDRIEAQNVYILNKIGQSVKKIGTLSPSKAQQLGQILKYGGSYNEIAKKLAKITEINTKEIYKIFDEVAKKDYQFAENFYKYRNVDYIPYEKNEELQRQVRAIARITTSRYNNLSNTLGFTRIVNGKRVFTPLYKVYTNIIDEAVLAVSQGKETFDEQMYRAIKEMGESGVKCVDYASTYLDKNGVERFRTRRLDSAIRMNMRAGLRDLQIETQKQFGEEFGADGVEISVHENPAPDHQEVQGHQFSNEEFYKFQNDEDAVDYQGNAFTADFDGHDRRSIGQYNCYHAIFSIVLGVNKPNYTNEQLQKIIDRNNKGFDLDGKHYNMYQGTQLQRQIETEIRKQKDAQILAKASGQDDLVLQAQSNIAKLNQKYKELCNVSGLAPKKERMRVSGYKRTAIKRK